MIRHLLSLLFILVLVVELHAATGTVRILHVNDFHGFAKPVRQSRSVAPLGGAARLASVIQQHRDVPGLLLSAGDMVQGDSWANLFQGRSSIELMNLLRFDAMVLGNHEFDFGKEQLVRLIAIARFPVLAANLDGMPSVAAKATFVRNGIRIAVIGLVTDDTPKSSHPRNTIGLTFASPLETARRQIAQVAPDTDLIVLLTHIGHDQDKELAGALCGTGSVVALPLLIAGGHSHTKVDHPVRIGNCTVAQAWEYGKALGVVDYTFDADGRYSVAGRLLDIGPDSGEEGSPEVAALVDRYNREVDAVLGCTVGAVAVDLVQQGGRQRETNLGNLVADLVRTTTGAQVAIINGGSLRTGLPAGAITARQVYSVLPFDNYLVAVRMSGRQLLETLEHGVSAVEHGEGRFPQVSGIRFSYRPDRPAGNRLLEATVNGVPVDPAAQYTVATLDYIAAGGDGYTAFGQAIRSAGDFKVVGGALQSSSLVYHDPGRYLRDIFIDAALTGASLSAAVEGRIIEVR